MGLPFRDVSYANGAYNMDANHDQIIAMKASGGDGVKHPLYLDDQLVRNYANAIRLRKVPILYHFAGGKDPVVEATYFISAASPLATGDVYALDWEIEHPDPVGWVNKFVTHVHAVTGAWPLVYMDIDRCNRFNWTPVFNNCGLWIAAPSFSFNAKVPIKHPYIAQQGPIVGGVDTDMWFDTLEVLKKYAYHKPVAVPPPKPAQPVTPVVQSPVAPVPTTPSPTAPVVVASSPSESSSPLVTEPESNVTKKGIFTMVSQYNKFLVALVGVILTYLTVHYGANVVVQDAVMVATALGVFQVSNTPKS